MTQIEQTLCRFFKAFENYNTLENIPEANYDPAIPHQVEWAEAYWKTREVVTKLLNEEQSTGSGDSQLKTIGETRVRTSFNPSQSDIVLVLKQRTAELINLCQSIKNDESVKPENDTAEKPRQNSGEVIRLVSLAQTAYEEGAMWAVKAATT